MKIQKAVVFFMLSFSCATCFGWGQTGHRITGKIAERYLTKKAKKELARILEGHSIAMVSTWMDEIRSDSTYNYTADWHWVTIEDGTTYDESPKNKNGDVIATIERLIAELKTKALSEKQEREHVKMLIHLIGDIHQPLHVGGGFDRGGNDVKVMWFRADSNLHRVWDTDMIDDTKLSYTEFAASLPSLSEGELKKLQQSSVRDWAKESMLYRKQVYNYGKGRLGYEYSYYNLPAVRKRLLEAGVRIAAVLNQLYGS